MVGRLSRTIRSFIVLCGVRQSRPGPRDRPAQRRRRHQQHGRTVCRQPLVLWTTEAAVQLPALSVVGDDIFE